MESRRRNPGTQANHTQNTPATTYTCNLHLQPPQAEAEPPERFRAPRMATLQALRAQAYRSPPCGCGGMHQTRRPDAQGSTAQSARRHSGDGEASTGKGRCPVPRVELVRRLSASAEELHEAVTIRSTTGKDRGPKKMR